MKINYHFEDMATGEELVYLVHDGVSPTGGYTEAYLNESGRGLEDRVQEMFGNDYLVFVRAELAPKNAVSAI
jgi:hypothetical protein